MVKITVNARFMTRPPTGVDRVAIELINAVSRMPVNRNSRSIEFIAPARAKINEFYRDIPVRTCGNLTGQLWEQIELPRYVKDSVLVSPCNVGPILVKNQCLVIHDANVFLMPNAYSFLFKLWYRMLLPRLAGKVETVLTVSEYSKSQLEKFNVVQIGKSIVVPNGGDHILSVEGDSRILDRECLLPNKYFMVIGSKSLHKNLNVLLDAMNLESSSSHTLVVAGGVDENVYARSEFTSARNVRYVGRVSDQELKALYENTIALLFPSTYEGFGLPPLEAMYVGCPVIASNTSAIPEVCGDAVLYADPLNPSTWLERMNLISADEKLRNSMINAGYERAKKYSWSKAAQKLIKTIMTRK